MAESRGRGRLDHDLSQSRIGCAVMVAVVAVAAAAAAVWPTVSKTWRDFCCAEEDIQRIDVATVRLYGYYKDEDPGLAIIDAADAETFWSLVSLPDLYDGSPGRRPLGEVGGGRIDSFVDAEALNSVAKATVATDEEGRAVVDLPFGSYLICKLSDRLSPKIGVKICGELDLCEDTTAGFGLAPGAEFFVVEASDPGPGDGTSTTRRSYVTQPSWWCE